MLSICIPTVFEKTNLNKARLIDKAHVELNKRAKWKCLKKTQNG